MSQFDDFFDKPKWDELRRSLESHRRDAEIGHLPDLEALFGGLSNIVSRMTAELLPLAAKKGGLPEAELQRRILKAHMVLDRRVNGHTSSQDDWNTFQVELNVGLMIYFNSMAKLFASRVSASDRTGETGGPGISFDETVDIASTLIIGFLQGSVLQSRHVDLLSLTDYQVLQAAMLRDSAERFVVAHELGHVVMHVRRGPLNELNVARSRLKQCLTAMTASGQRDHEIHSDLEEAWAAEICADLIGYELCRDIFMRHRQTIPNGFLGIEVMFLMQDMVERTRDRRSGSNYVGTHPPSSVRLEVLRSVVRESLLAIFLQLGQLYEHLAGVILDAVYKKCGLA